MTVSSGFIAKAIIDTATTVLNNQATQGNQPARWDQVQAAILAGEPLFAVSDAIYSNASAAASVAGTVNYTVGQTVIAFDTVGSFVANGLYRVTVAGTISTATFTPLNVQNGTAILATKDLAHPTDTTKMLLANQQYKLDTTQTGFAQWVDIGSRAADGDYTIAVDVDATTSNAYNFDQLVGVGTEIESVEMLVATAINGTVGTGSVTVGDAGNNSKVLQATDIIFGANTLQGFVAGMLMNLVPLDQSTGKKITFASRDQLAVYVTAPTGATTGLLQFRIHCKA